MKTLTNKIAALLVFVQLFLCAAVSGRDFIPTPPPFKTSMQPAMSSGGPKVNMLVLWAGVALGGKQNTAYFLKSRLTLVDKFHLYGSMYYHINHDQLNFASVGFGNVVELSVGMEWGDRTFFVPKDSTFQYFHFKNAKTGEDVHYLPFVGVTFPQQVNAYTLGLTFRVRKPATNFWRGTGSCWAIYEFKWEMMYAPNVDYAETIEVTTEGEYETMTANYEMVDEKVRHWGIRMVADTRLSSKLGMMMEFGLRPGVRNDLNENHRFGGGYLRIGVSVGLALGGRKALSYAD
jgi:hypothetical protein